MKKVLAFDIGASSGRTVLGEYRDNAVTLTEIHRFTNAPVRVNGHLYWDILRLFHEIKRGIVKCVNTGNGDIASIGIDTWGVDYGLIDKNGELIGNPYHYRDERTAGVAEKAAAALGKNLLYAETGIQIMDINTAYQLASGDIPENADKLLFTPDLLSYFLTDEKKCERTILSTSQLLNPRTNELSAPILDGLGIRRSLFCPVVEAGEVFGLLRKEIADELRLPQIPVIAVASHDTASAVAGIPFDSGEKAFISCGTWSLIGRELDKPLINDMAAELNFSNESGFGGSICLLKNITGLWLERACRTKWEHAGEDVSYSLLNKVTKEAPPFQAYINPNDPCLLSPCDMTEAIRDFCVKTGQTPPRAKGEYLMTIIQSLAMKYRQNVEELEKLTATRLTIIHMVGGGIRNELLCQFTANATGKTVMAGPVEATAAGNTLAQLIALGEINSLSEGREIIKNSLPVTKFIPENMEKWNEEYMKYQKICGETV